MNNRCIIVYSVCIPLFLWGTALPSDDKQSNRAIACVSLGWNCHVAENLRKNNVRYAAFPFDWNQTSFYALCNLIENHFADLLNPDFLVYSRPGAAGIFNIKYTMALSHDFPVIRDAAGIDHSVENYVDFIPEIQAKYVRRIQRFYAVCNEAQHVYFFRAAPRIAHWPYDIYQGKEKMQELRDILRRLFPHDNWTLIALCNSDEYRDDWHMLQVRNFYINDPGAGNVEEWKSILRQLDLI